MPRKVLKNKPLVEAIFQLQWELRESQPGIAMDPNYKLLIGRLYDRISNEYPFHEQLPAAAMPDEMAPYMVQHRFRKAKDKWPLIQIGSGIITVNDTEGYVWEDFEGRIMGAVDILREVYPESKDNFKINRLLLRYIDAIAFDFEKDDVFNFLRQQVKTNIRLYKNLFEDTKVEKLPLGLDLRFSFASSQPKGIIHLRFARGKTKEVPVLIWETMVESVSEDVPDVPDKIADWVNEAHNLTNDWFFKLIEGELLRRFE